MSGEQTFWLRLWTTLAAIGAVGIGSCSCIVNYQDNTATVRMVERGANPIVARCAVRGIDPAVCSIVAVKVQP